MCNAHSGPSYAAGDIAAMRHLNPRQVTKELAAILARRPLIRRQEIAIRMILCSRDRRVDLLPQLAASRGDKSGAVLQCRQCGFGFYP